MRPRNEIEKDTKPFDRLTLEVLLDVREILNKAPQKPKAKRGRPKKIK